MQAHAGDAGVFIRSMATRGHLGGLARATSDAALRPRRRRQGHRHHRDRRRRPGRSGHRPHRRRVDRDARARRRRRGAGAQGRHHGDRRHLRGQQGGPRGRGSHGGVDRGDAVAADVRRRTSGGRRSSRPRRRPARACRSWSATIERFRAHTAATQRRAAAGARRVPRCASCSRSASCSTSSGDVLAAGRVRRRCSIASPRARSIRTPAAGRRVARARALEQRADRRARHEGRLDHVGIAVADLGAGAGVLPRRARARDRRAGGGAVAARAGAFHPGGRVGARTARGDRRRLADREVRREARARAASHHAAGRGHRAPRSRS